MRPTDSAPGRARWRPSELDLTPYVSTIRLLTTNAREWDRMPIALDGLTGFEIDLRLSAARVTIGRAKVGRTAVAASLRGGKLLVTVGESQAFNGVIKGSLAIAKSETGADVKSEMQFTDVDLDTCLGELFGLRRLEGKGNLSFALEGAGDSVLSLTRTLAGTVDGHGPARRAHRHQCRAGAAPAGAAPAVGRRRRPQRPHAVRASSTSCSRSPTAR